MKKPFGGALVELCYEIDSRVSETLEGRLIQLHRSREAFFVQVVTQRDSSIIWGKSDLGGEPCPSYCARANTWASRLMGVDVYSLTMLTCAGSR